MADEDLVRLEERGQKSIDTTTKRGLTLLKERGERGDAAPWATVHVLGRPARFREAVAGLKMAAKQVATVGAPDQHDRATVIVVEARGTPLLLASWASR